MPEITKDFDYDAAIKELRRAKLDHEKHNQYEDYAKKMAYIHGAYFAELQDAGFTHEEAFELMKIWSNNITKKDD